MAEKRVKSKGNGSWLELTREFELSHFDLPGFISFGRLSCMRDQTESFRGKSFAVNFPNLPFLSSCFPINWFSACMHACYPQICSQAYVLMTTLLFLSLKNNSCLINGYCFAPNETNPIDWCYQCLPQISTSAWSKRQGNYFTKILYSGIP